MHRQPLRKVRHGGFRAGIRRNFGERRVGVHRRNVDNIAALARDHIAGERLRGDQNPHKIEVKNGFDARLVQIKEALGVGVQIARLIVFLVGRGTGVVAARTVEEDVTGAKVPQNLLMACENSGLVQHVAFVCFRSAALGGDLLGQLPDICICPAQQRDLRAACGQRLGKDAAKRPGCAGHDRNLAGQVCVQGKVHHIDLLVRYRRSRRYCRRGPSGSVFCARFGLTAAFIRWT